MATVSHATSGKPETAHYTGKTTTSGDPLNVNKFDTLKETHIKNLSGLRCRTFIKLNLAQYAAWLNTSLTETCHSRFIQTLRLLR
jgi:triacylglycerol esterase/lipase EstA (alpha/beta hydrolase family)